MGENADDIRAEADKRLEERDLFAVLPAELFEHKDCFDSHAYWRWEDDIATPALKARGFEVGRWWTIDGDSFGPLVRGVRLTKDGATHTYSYG